MRYGKIFHEPEISRHISQLTSVISDLFLEAHPWFIFPLTNKFCTSIIESATHMLGNKVSLVCGSAQAGAPK